MKISVKITRFLTGAAILSMVATPTLAGKGNSTGLSEGEYGPGDCNQSSVEFTMNHHLLLARDQARDQSRDHGGDGKDQARDQTRDRDC